MQRARRTTVALVVTFLLTSLLVPFSVSAETRAPAWVDGALTVELPDVAAAAVGPEAPRVRARSVEAPIAFSTLWVELPDDVDEVRVRTSLDGASWDPWTVLEREDDEDAPDPGTTEAATAISNASEPLMTGEDGARFLQLEAPAGADDLVVQLVDTEGHNESVLARAVRLATPRVVPATAEASTRPFGVRSRASWGAAAPRGSISTASSLRQLIIHHTATPNEGTTLATVERRLRSMQAYHQGLGWSDLGYNIVIDQAGRVWEGRAGGIERAVVGAHARGFNTGSSGIAVIGDFTDRNPSETVLETLDKVVGWKAGIHGVDTTGTVTINGTRYPTVAGHRTVGTTTCPGRIQNSLGRIRTNAKQYGDPRFPDVPWDSVHRPHVLRLADHDVLLGSPDGRYRPRRSLTRGQMASVLGRALGLEQLAHDGRFEDVDADNVHVGYITALAERGIVHGVDDGRRYEPDQPVRRDQLASFLTRARNFVERPEHVDFDDVRASNVHFGRIGAANYHSIVTGYTLDDGTREYRPKLPVRRDQAATMISRTFSRLPW